MKSRFMRLLAVVLALFAATLTCAQGGYPNRQITIIVGFSLGGSTDFDARLLKTPEIRERLIHQGVDPVGSTPDEFAACIRAEKAKWAKVVKASGAKAD